jgi:glucose uptake protein GlcU
MFVPAFGVGAFITAVGMLFVRYLKDDFIFLPFFFKETFLMGFLSGILANLTNIFVILALPLTSYSVANPLLQLSLIVAGTYGIYIFNEIKGNAITVFYLTSFLLVVGAIMLSVGYEQ